MNASGFRNCRDLRGVTRGLRRRQGAAAELELGDALAQSVHRRGHPPEPDPHDDETKQKRRRREHRSLPVTDVRLSGDDRTTRRIFRASQARAVSLSGGRLSAVPRVGIDSTRVEVVTFGKPQAREFGLGEPFPERLGREARGRCRAPPAARLSAIVRHGGDRRGRVVAEHLVRCSSTRMCGTISPPILLNRDSRSVMRMKPSSSIEAMSPVTYQPSWSTSRGHLGLVQVAEHHVRALDQQQPFARPAALAGSGSTTAAARPGSGWPTDPAWCPAACTPALVTSGCSPPPPATAPCSRSPRARRRRSSPRRPRPAVGSFSAPTIT